MCADARDPQWIVWNFNYFILSISAIKSTLDIIGKLFFHMGVQKDNTTIQRTTKFNYEADNTAIQKGNTCSYIQLKNQAMQP